MRDGMRPAVPLARQEYAGVGIRFQVAGLGVDEEELLLDPELDDEIGLLMCLPNT